MKKIDIRFEIIPDQKLYLLKAIRDTLGLSLKDAIGWVRAGHIPVDESQAYKVVDAIRPFTANVSDVNYLASLQEAKKRIESILGRYQARSINKVADWLEQLEARIWG